MDRMGQLRSNERLRKMCEEFCETSVIDNSLYNKFGVKRGLRNADGSGVLAGITNV